MSHERPTIEHNSHNGRPASIWYAVAFILFSAVMAGWHWLLSGINADFGTGAVVGFTLGAGIIFLLSRKARELP